MDKMIIFGRVYKFFSVKSQKDYFKIDYLTDDGVACSDFIDIGAYNRICSQNISTGSLVTARLQLNQFNRGEIFDISC